MNRQEEVGLPTEAEVERYARAICRAWDMDPDAEYLDDPYKTTMFRKPPTTIGWKMNRVQRLAWAYAACAKVDAEIRSGKAATDD